MSIRERFEACEQRASVSDVGSRGLLTTDQKHAAQVGGLLALSLPPKELRRRFDVLLSEGCGPEFLEDIVRQIAAYIGYPKVNACAEVLHQAISDAALQVEPPENVWDRSDDDRYAAGTTDYNQLNPTALATIRAAFDEAAPDLADLTFRAFGDVYASSRLPLQTRQFATVTSLACLGGVAPQLRFHFGASLHVGVTYEQLVETIYIVQSLAGMPAAYNAMIELKAAHESQGEPPPYR